MWGIVFQTNPKNTLETEPLETLKTPQILVKNPYRHVDGSLVAAHFRQIRQSSAVVQVAAKTSKNPKSQKSES